MQYITLEHIDQYIADKIKQKKYLFRNICKEVFQFGAVFLSVFLLSTIIVNANLFYHTVKNIFTPVSADNTPVISATLSQSGDEKREALAEQSRNIEEKVQQSVRSQPVLPDHRETMSYYLSAKAKTYAFEYNTLPPENRLIIPAIGVNAPIVDVSAATEEKLRKGDFDQELYSGVVKYPSTPEPGSTGNALIFGHTSYYRWKNNPFAEIFSKLTALKEGDLIQTLWHGQLAEFEVVAKIVVNPGQVDDAYMKYTDGKYITLMGCYPIGSDARRILIVAKKKETTSLSTTNLSLAQK